VNMPDELRCDPEVEAEAEARINEESKVRVKKYLDARVIRGMRELGYSDSDIGRIVDMSADEVDEFMRNYVE
jgi:SOS response regulatory protein OraA/RecX